MNFIEEFNKGQSGGNKGLPMGKGLKHISKAVNGVQKQRMYGVGAPPKAGKSTYVDYGYLISPYIYAVENNIPIEWIYLSFELDRISKEFDFATHFLHADFGISLINLPPGVTRAGSNTVELSPDYLRGRMQDDKEKTITVSPDILTKLQHVYATRIVPMFGEFDAKGKQISKGYITFREYKDTPQRLYEYLKRHAEKHGTFTYEETNGVKNISMYKPNNVNKYTIIITDHLRKITRDKGQTMKDAVDKYVELTVELRNICAFTFVHIIHLNRSLSEIGRIREFGDMLYPSSDDIKDTGNLAEDADYVFTMMNPNDSRYNLKKHFGNIIKDKEDNPIYPNLRSVHLVESRHCEFPQHFSVNMYGGVKSFEQIIFKK